MARTYFLFLLVLLACSGCKLRLKPVSDAGDAGKVTIERYDRIESLFLTTGDFSALQQMNTSYPIQTRMLIEDVLHIGKANDPEISKKFLHFFQDSTLVVMLRDVQEQYADVDDLNEELTKAFSRLMEDVDGITLPQVYAQVGSFDQSIIVGHQTLGISLDKYLGPDYPFYKDNYTEGQRKMMKREMIVPDCMGFYLLSLYPIPQELEDSQVARDSHMGRIQWVVNRLTGRTVFNNAFVQKADRMMKENAQMTIDQLLRSKDTLN